MSVKFKSVLITGGAGFIGSNLARFLVLNFCDVKVKVLDNLSTGFRHNIEDLEKYSNFEFINADIRDKERCLEVTKDIEIVLHQAALGSVQRSIKNPILTHEVNTLGFLNILNACKENKVRKVIFASSSSVFGDNLDLIKKENRLGNPISPYAVSKVCKEHYAQVFSKLYGMDILGLRYFNVFGYFQNTLGAYAAVIPIFISNTIKKQSSTIYGTGNQERDFTFIENIIQANIKAMITEKRFQGEAINIACNKTNSINKVYSIISRLLKFEESPEYKLPRKGDIENSLADISLAKSLIDYQPVVFLEEGLKKTVNWFLKNS